ncbi:extracellular solute-binding protein [Paenibacillus sp. P26]|nr:extracellular solute-binding protein [Paenibacillus sp. P26]
MDWKRVSPAMLAFVTAAGLVAGCSDQQAGGGKDGSAPGGSEAKDVHATGFPIVKEPLKLTFFAGKADSAPANWNDVEIWKEYAKMTGITIDWRLTPSSDPAALAQKRNVILAGGDLPDAFHTARFSSTDIANYGDQGLLIPLNGLIDKYAPNVKKALDSNPEVKKGLTMPDGNIYSLPTFYDPSFRSVVIGSEFWINKKFLDALGMKEPTTTEEYYQYLKAVKTQDPNKNGKNDEIPFAASGVLGGIGIVDQLKGAWGLGNRGNTHSRVDVDPKTNKLRFEPADPGYKESLEYLNRLYKEDLFIPDIMTIKGPEMLAKGKEGLYGSFIHINESASFGTQTGDYVGLTALKGPHGDQVFSRARSPLIDIGAFAITNKNKHPEATMRWVDYFYSEEGSKMFFMGIKDKSYVVKPDGTLDYSDEIKKDKEAQKKYVTFAGGFYPAMLTKNTYFGGESYPENLEAVKKIEPYYPKEVWPAFTYTQEELTRFTPLSNDINKYVDEMTVKFIMGNAPFSEWDNYIATLKKMGLEDYMKIYTAAYERYSKK